MTYLLIGRVRKRNSALIESLLEAGLSFREISKVAGCSHGSVFAQKKEMLARKLKEAQAAKSKSIVLIPEIVDENSTPGPNYTEPILLNEKK